MAAHRSSESLSPPPRTKPYHGRSRRSPSSSSHSSSSRSRRLKRAKEPHASSGGDESDRRRHKNYDKRDHGRSRERYYNAERERERGRGRKDRDNDGIKNGERNIEKDRSEKYREEDGSREKPLRDRRQERSSPKRSHLSRSLSPRGHSSPKRTSASSPSRRRRSWPEDKLRALAASTASRAEVVSEKGDRSRADGEEDSVAKMMAAEAALEAKQKEKNKPSFEYSGKLAAETNRVRGVTLLFTEPPEARKPTIRWRLYVFKEGEPFNEPLYIHRQSCYLFGRERRVADIPTDHISCSKQHAVIQYRLKFGESEAVKGLLYLLRGVMLLSPNVLHTFRLTEKEEADGATSDKVRPYLMDLGSTNGTFLNAERLESHRYYELYEKDTIKFGNSSREYVLLHENSAA